LITIYKIAGHPAVSAAKVRNKLVITSTLCLFLPLSGSSWWKRGLGYRCFSVRGSLKAAWKDIFRLSQQQGDEDVDPELVVYQIYYSHQCIYTVIYLQ